MEIIIEAVKIKPQAITATLAAKELSHLGYSEEQASE
jgi:hypothetical protein